MKLREHPLMSYQGVRSWPPKWLWGGGGKYVHAIGEVGVLKDVILSSIEPYKKCFLIMEYEERKYIGTIQIEDSTFCQELYTGLTEQRGKPIKDIGEIDFNYMPK
jgi:hypothetical protein